MNASTRIHPARTLLLGVVIGTAGMYALGLHAQSTPIAGPSTSSLGKSSLAPKPIDPHDTVGWKAYLGHLVQMNIQGMSASRPFVYLVDAGDTSDAEAHYAHQLANLADTASRGVQPGNLIALTGANSAKNANLVVAAFKDAKPGSFNDAIVLFIGDKADEQRVNDAIKPTGATIRFVAM